MADNDKFQSTIAMFVGDPPESIYEVYDLKVTSPLGKDIQCPAKYHELVEVSPAVYKYDSGSDDPIVFSDSECIYGRACTQLDFASNELVVESY